MIRNAKYPHRSTSPVANLMEQDLAACRADALEILGWAARAEAELAAAAAESAQGHREDGTSLIGGGAQG